MRSELLHERPYCGVCSGVRVCAFVRVDMKEGDNQERVEGLGRAVDATYFLPAVACLLGAGVLC